VLEAADTARWGLIAYMMEDRFGLTFLLWQANIERTSAIVPPIAKFVN
jgi:hypothetical protein